MPEKRIIIIGGGLAGLITSIDLARSGVAATIVEKRQYPFHRVCGEYVSNEVVPYLQSLGAYPESLHPARISRFQLSATQGRLADLPLDLGGFGISRFAFDYFLYQRALQLGVQFKLNTSVMSTSFHLDTFRIETSDGVQEADIVVGSYGKLSRLDKQLHRSFVHRHSPYVGVKYHVKLPEYPNDLISLHNFSHGYCGISRVENDIVNVCYLTHRNNVRRYGNLRTMEEAVLFRNPFIRSIFEKSEFLFDRPETINEISFQTKQPVENHILMIGDAAGMIAPLCGNGMAMAIHSAKIVSERLLQYCHDKHYTRAQLEQDYAGSWKRKFATRLWAGRTIQKLFGDNWTSNLAVNIARHARPVAGFLMKKTHGNPF